MALLGSLIGLSYASVLSYLSIYAQEKGLFALASTFFLVFAAVMLLTRPFTGRLFDEKGPQYVMIPGFITFAIGLVLLANMDSALVIFNRRRICRFWIWSACSEFPDTCGAIDKT